MGTLKTIYLIFHIATSINTSLLIEAVSCEQCFGTPLRRGKASFLHDSQHGCLAELFGALDSLSLTYCGP